MPASNCTLELMSVVNSTVKRTCTHATNCPRLYSTDLVACSAAEDQLHPTIGEQWSAAHQKARAACARNEGSDVLSAGAWCLSRPPAVPRQCSGFAGQASSWHCLHREKARSPHGNASSYYLPKHHVLPDERIIFLLASLLGLRGHQPHKGNHTDSSSVQSPVATLASAVAATSARGRAQAVSSGSRQPSLLDLGAGVGQYGHALRAIDARLDYAGYDGSGNIENVSSGFVRWADLSLPLDRARLPRRDWIMSLEVGEHLPNPIEPMFVRNLHALNRHGMVLSWGAYRWSWVWRP